MQNSLAPGRRGLLGRLDQLGDVQPHRAHRGGELAGLAAEVAVLGAAAGLERHDALDLDLGPAPLHPHLVREREQVGQRSSEVCSTCDDLRRRRARSPRSSTCSRATSRIVWSTACAVMGPIVAHRAGSAGTTVRVPVLAASRTGSGDAREGRGAGTARTVAGTVSEGRQAGRRTRGVTRRTGAPTTTQGHRFPGGGRMRLELLTALTEATGPFLTVSSDVSRVDVAGAREVELRWEARGARLAAAGAPPEVVGPGGGAGDGKNRAQRARGPARRRDPRPRRAGPRPAGAAVARPRPLGPSCPASCRSSGACPAPRGTPSPGSTGPVRTWRWWGCSARPRRRRPSTAPTTWCTRCPAAAGPSAATRLGSRTRGSTTPAPWRASSTPSSAATGRSWSCSRGTSRRWRCCRSTPGHELASRLVRLRTGGRAEGTSPEAEQEAITAAVVQHVRQQRQPLVERFAGALARQQEGVDGRACRRRRAAPRAGRGAAPARRPGLGGDAVGR